MQKIQWLIGFGVLSLSTVTMAADPQGRGQRALEQLDSNGDGNVDFTEFQQNGPDVLANLDADGDNAVSLDEFLQGRPLRPRRGRGGPANGQGPQPNEEELAEIQAMRLERATEQFNEMDLDGSGLLSAMEIQEANFLRMDDDGNGVLSAAELRRRGPGAMNGRGAGRRGPGRGQHSEPETDNS
ncbi:MAG: hypothetical protein RL839_16985 [Gammaproteobacteria bacterium]